MSDDSESPAVIPNSDDITPSVTETENEDRQKAKKKKKTDDLSEVDIEDQIETEEEEEEKAEKEPIKMSRSKSSKKQPKKQVKKQSKKNKKISKKSKKPQMKRQNGANDSSSISSSDSESYSSTSSDSSDIEKDANLISSISISSGGDGSKFSEYVSDKWNQTKKTLGSAVESIKEAPQTALSQLQNIMQPAQQHLQQPMEALMQVPAGFENMKQKLGMLEMPQEFQQITQHPFAQIPSQPAISAALGSAVAKLIPQQNPMLSPMQQMNKALGSAAAHLDPMSLMASQVQPMPQQMIPQLPQESIQNIQMQSGVPTLPVSAGVAPVAIPMNGPIQQGGAKKQRKYKIVKDHDFFF